MRHFVLLLFVVVSSMAVDEQASLIKEKMTQKKLVCQIIFVDIVDVVEKYSPGTPEVCIFIDEFPPSIDDPSDMLNLLVKTSQVVFEVATQADTEYELVILMATDQSFIFTTYAEIVECSNSKVPELCYIDHWVTTEEHHP